MGEAPANMDDPSTNKSEGLRTTTPWPAIVIVVPSDVMLTMGWIASEIG